MDLSLAKDYIKDGELECAIIRINRAMSSICETEEVEKPKYRSGTYDEDLYDKLMKMQAEINDNKQVIQNLIKSWNHRANQIAECCK